MPNRQTDPNPVDDANASRGEPPTMDRNYKSSRAVCGETRVKLTNPRAEWRYEYRLPQRRLLLRLPQEQYLETVMKMMSLKESMKNRRRFGSSLDSRIGG